MTSERSKRRDFLALVFISKSISKKLLLLLLLLLLLAKAINHFDSHYQLNEAPPLEVLPFRNRIETYTQKKRKYIFLFASWSKKPRANQMARRFLSGVEKTI